MNTFPKLQERMAEVGEAVQFQPGQKIINQHQSANYFFVIKAGTVEMLNEEAEKIHIKYLSQGQCFGEVECLTGEPYPYSAVAANEVDLYRAPRDTLIQLTAELPEFNSYIINSLCQKINIFKQGRQPISVSQQNNGLLDPEQLICNSAAMRAIKDRAEFHKESGHHLLIIGERGVGKRFLARHIQQGSGLDPLVEVEAMDHGSLLQTVNAAQGGTVIIHRPELLPYNLAYQLAEAVELQSKKQKPPRFILSCRRVNAAVDLVRKKLVGNVTYIEMPTLRERSEDIPQLAAMFLKHYALKHNLRVYYFSDAAINKLCRYSYLDGNVEQLAKIVERAVILSREPVVSEQDIVFKAQTIRTTERPKIGLALGAGAVRGVAHIGVAKVLYKHNIPIDMIAGTSAGALVGSCLAAGVEPEKLEKIVENMSWSRIASPLWPKRSLLDNIKLGQYLERVIGKKEFCQLNIPFVAVATDAYTGEEVVLSYGKVSDAVRASTAIPVIFKPVELYGRTLMDGAPANMVPASVCKSMGADIVIAVSVNDFSFESGPPKNIYMSVLHYMDMIMKKQVLEAEGQWADVLVKVSKPGLSGYNFKEAKQYIEAGQEAAEQAIPRIKELINAWQR
ncbi:patatin-like phospholipase family protein [Desulfofalx alkaliphila]|uniref:patatin-like phospholipase family protein n=1 Tax=Desulfofalx alkaliphila TaxID=105483 RepID=UPI000691AA55|nr:patatin-like phospholipase family protein [Desulfofalx alkaliphila]